jgi:isopentenyl phosphate kinase
MIFLKLGGSLITDKSRPETVRTDVLDRLAHEIADGMRADPKMQLLLGHGSGSFGHQAATRYGTHQGAASREDWLGFAEVWRVANRLNRLVIDALYVAGLPAVSFPPSASGIAGAGDLTDLATEPIERALAAGILPVVAGDVAFDRQRGSTIVSTERVFGYLAPHLRPTRLLFAGVDAGVYADFPANTRLYTVLTDAELADATVTGSAATDVTGGMADKVRQAMALVRLLPGLEVRIFSGEVPGMVVRALAGEPVGTLVRPT